jgi:hypothetical protein
MRCVQIATVALFVAMALVVAPPACAQSLPTLDEATALVRKAIGATDLGATDTPPFHMTAHVHYMLVDGKKTDGTYEMLFATRDRYREEIRFGKATETHVVSDGKLYVSRSTRNPTVEAWRTRELMRFPGGHAAWSNAAIQALRVGAVTSPQGKQTCVDAGDTIFDRGACFDPATNEVLVLSVKTKAVHVVASQTIALQLSDFMTLTTLRYPKHMVQNSSWDSVEVSVDKLEAPGAFDDHAFDPPANAAARDWCAAPTYETPPRQMQTQTAIVLGPPAVFSFVVDKQGHATHVTEIRSATYNSTVDPIRKSIENRKQAIRLCNGKPVEYEAFIVTDIAMR